MQRMLQYEILNELTPRQRYKLAHWVNRVNKSEDNTRAYFHDNVLTFFGEYVNSCLTHARMGSHANLVVREIDRMPHNERTPNIRRPRRRL